MNRVEKEKFLTITVDVEEWFHSNWFDADHIIKTYYDGKTPQSDVVHDINKIITMFDTLDIRATFFVLGGTVERYPSIIDSIKDAGHEIASHGYYHQNNGINVDLFREDIREFRRNVYSHVKGYRFPNYIFQSNVLEVLSDEGFLYDSSMVPSFNVPGWYRNPSAPIKPYICPLNNDQQILEFPISVSPFLRFPGAGGWFLRNASVIWTYHIIMSQLKRNGYANLYFHNWEIMDNAPNHPGIPFHVFRNTGIPMMKRIRFLIELWKKMDSIHIEPFEELLSHEINEPR